MDSLRALVKDAETWSERANALLSPSEPPAPLEAFVALVDESEHLGVRCVNLQSREGSYLFARVSVCSLSPYRLWRHLWLWWMRARTWE